MKNKTQTKNHKTEAEIEKDIIKNVYQYEASRTYKTIFIVWAVFIVVQFLIVILGSSIYQTLKEQQTLDLFQLFSEDFDIIRENLGDVLYTLYLESPQLLLAILISLFLTMFGIIFFIIKNFKKIKNRFGSISKFYAKKMT